MLYQKMMKVKKVLQAMAEKMSWVAPYFLDVARIIFALMFILIGSMALFGFPIAIFPGGSAPLFSWSWFISIVEFAGGILVLFGFLTRPAAFLLAIEMVIAYVKVSAPRNILPVLNGGQTTMLYFFFWTYLVLVGAGPISIDAIIRRWCKKKELTNNNQ